MPPQNLFLPPPPPPHPQSRSPGAGPGTRVYHVQEVKDEMSVKDLQARYPALQWGFWVSTYF